MIAQTLFHELLNEGVHLWAEQGQLRYRGRSESLTRDRLAQLAQHKSELLLLLAGHQTAKSSPGPGLTADFSVLFFASDEAERQEDKYSFLIKATQFADKNDFCSVWLPERHFHRFGGLYPNPSTLCAALAMLTQRVRLRAGSVVLPLHHPLRVAEEWAVVDNLSNGRVDLAFAQGWNSRDFVLSPDAYPDRLRTLYEGMEQVSRLWRGQTVSLRDGGGQLRDVSAYPRPRQSELNVWLTCTGSSERFREAGAMGVNVLTALLFQTAEELTEKIAIYRQARRDNGFDPNEGKVSLMLHTFVGNSVSEVRHIVKAPFTEYLRTSVDLWKQEMKGLTELTSEEQQDVLEYAFDRYFQTATLFGTPDSCSPFVERLIKAGVDEFACLMDFGVSTESILSNLSHLNALRRRFSRPSADAPIGGNPTFPRSSTQHTTSP